MYCEWISLGVINKITFDICDPPREIGREVNIYKIDFHSLYDSCVLSVSITERIKKIYLYLFVL